MHLLMLVSHSGVQFEAPNTTCAWLSPGTACVRGREREREEEKKNKTKKQNKTL